ncbi:MAG: peptidoglycan-associated lipoprotein Pal [Nitrospiraceae bacterium]
MKISCVTISLIGAVGLLLLATPGCSKKSVQASSGSKSSEAAKRGGGGPGGVGGFGTGSVSEQPIGPSGMPDSASGVPDSSGGTGRTIEPDYNSNIPSLSQSGGEMGGAPGYPAGDTSHLSGLDSMKSGSAPGEERLGGGPLLAKVQPSESAARQTEELRQEQLASAAAGLQDVFFAYDSWQINEEGRRVLAVDADWIRTNPDSLVKIEGHCDERGTSAYNLVLGEKRAKAVRNYLVELGVAANQLSVVSYGKERPFCHEHAESCHQQNRRGHLVVRKK